MTCIGAWGSGFWGHMGGSRACPVAELEVSEVSRGIAVIRGSVRIYSFELCPRQDSNLRSRLRRPLLSPLSYGGSRTEKGYQLTGALRSARGPWLGGGV